jgi:FKBP-type peptidyl-prolyl cis-trans isomerase
VALAAPSTARDHRRNCKTRPVLPIKKAAVANRTGLSHREKVADMNLPRIVASALVMAACLTLVAGCGDEEDEAKELNVYTEKGQVVMRYLDLVEGKGEPVKKFDTVSVHYTGWLQNGTKFDSSYDRRDPLVFPVGVGKVIKGWDEGIIGMKVGGKRKLFIPAALGYGERANAKIPANSKLTFEVELLRINEE